MLFLRNDLEATILRLPGQLYQKKENNIISNVYTYKLVNKTSDQVADITFKLLSHDGTVTIVSMDTFDVPRQGLAEGTLYIDIPRREVDADNIKLKIGVYSGDELIETAKTTFLGPISYQ
jgi:hypothetical protein